MRTSYDPEHFDSLSSSLTAMSVQSKYLRNKLEESNNYVRQSLLKDETKQLMDKLDARVFKSSPRDLPTRKPQSDSPFRSMRYGMNNVLEGLSACEYHCRNSYGYTQKGMDILRKKYGNKNADISKTSEPASNSEQNNNEAQKPKSTGQFYLSSALERRAKRDARNC